MIESQALMTVKNTAYGTTWWGRRWLDALQGIDFENRIPRGKAYADEGRVLSFKCDAEQRLVKGRVEGNYDPFYVVRLSFEPVAADKLQALVDEMAASPLIVSRLAARELSPEIADICDRLGIRIFPHSWKDIGMKCSCPDEAVPCKHIAAVIYKMSEEIDANPFILFKLHGIDLIEQMQKRGVEIDRAEHVELPRWSDLVMQTEEPQPSDDDQWLAALSSLTFADPREQAETLCGLFAEKPAGYSHGCLRDDYKSVLRRAAQIASEQRMKRLERTLPDYDEEHPPLSVNGWGQVVPDASLVWRERDELGTMEVRQPAVRGVPFEAARPLHEMFSGYLTTTSFMDAPKELEALFYAWVIACKLTEKGAVLPQAYEPVEDFLAVRWMPAVLDQEVRETTIAVGEAFAHVQSEFLKLSGVHGTVDALLLGELVLGIFIQSFVREACRQELSEEKMHEEHKVLFAAKAVDRSEDAEIEALAMRVESWLAPLMMQAALPVRPIVVVHDFLAVDGELPADRPVGVELRFALKQGEHAVESVAFFDILQDPQYRAVRFDCLRAVSRLSQHCPALTDLLRNQVNVQQLSLSQLTELLFASIPALRLLGVDIVLPRSLQELLRPQAKLEIEAKEEWVEGSGLGGLAALLDFHWQLAVGNQAVSEDEFDRLCAHAGQIMRFKNGYMYVTAEEVAAIRKKLQQKNFSKAALLREALGANAIDENTGVKIGSELRRALQKIFTEKPVDLPSRLNASLRPYQQRGFRWMMRNLNSGVGSIIADDMGLGKTLQVLTVLERLREDGEFDEKRALIVVPASLVINWQREAQKFVPELKVGLYYGQDRALADAAACHAVLTTYGTLRTSIKEISRMDWRLLVIDEAQAIKNYRTSVFRAVAAVRAEGVIAMSGTPVENRLMEYWSVMEVVNRGLFGSASAFRAEYAQPIEVSRDRVVAEAFRRISAPFLLRRMKTDKSIISDLPDKVVNDEFCTLTKEQASLYKQEVNRGLELVNQAGTQFARRALVLQLMVRLKQICDSPTLYEGGTHVDKPLASGKMQRLFDILDEMHQAGRKVLIFTQFVQMGLLLQNWIEEHCGRRPQFLHGGLSLPNRQKMVDRFQKRRDENVLILSLRAAGTGLNLTAASAVVHYDLWWNPAVENQATDRAYRIGQKRNVNVYRFVTANTYEEKINQMIASKRELVDMTVAAGENWIGDLSQEDIASIFRLAQ